MSHRRFARLAPVLAAVSLFATALPVAAQNFSDGYQLLEAVRKRDGDKATELLNQPGSTLANARDKGNGETGLHIAARRRDSLWIRFLLDKGANPNIADRNGITPLMVATRLGDQDSVAALLKGGARVDDFDESGETPLIVATHLGDPGLVKVLLDNGADPDRADNSGRTSRDYARLDNNRRLLDAFDAHDAKQGQTAKTYGPQP